MAEPRLIAEIGEAESRLAALEEARHGLANRSVVDIAGGLAAACARWADPDDPDRSRAAAAIAARHRVPASALDTVFDAAFPRWTAEALLEWIRAELGGSAVLDGFMSLDGSRRRAMGPRLVVALSARGVPTTPVVDLLGALLVKAPIWLKPAAAGDDLASRFVTTLERVDPALAAAVETGGWTPESEVARLVLGSASTVVVTGDAATLERLREIVDGDTRLVCHGPRLSIAAIPAEALDDPREAIEALAADAAFAGQWGCLSPGVVFVEAAGDEVDSLAAPILEACTARWPGTPRNEAPADERAEWSLWMARLDLARAGGKGGTTAGGPDAGWTVVTRWDDVAEPPPVPRALVLIPVDGMDAVVTGCARWRGRVATVGVAGGASTELAERLAAAGVERIAPLGRMQRPPLAWRRDGRRTLEDLVRWVDLESP